MLYNTAFADAPWYINLFNYELIVAGACFFSIPSVTYRSNECRSRHDLTESRLQNFIWREILMKKYLNRYPMLNIKLSKEIV